MTANHIEAAQLGRIGVLMGGCSSESEISLKSGKAVFEALTNAGCDAAALKITTTDPDEILAQIALAQIDIAFLVLHGKFGEDGTIQTILEKAGIAYSGSGPQASRLAMDKASTQMLVQKAGIKVPDFFILDKKDQPHALKFLENFGGCPLVVKPSCEGSSIGITIVHHSQDFLPALGAAFEFGERILVDRYIQGKEVTAAVLGTEALPLVEIRPRGKFFDFSSKYQKGMSDYIVPAEIDANTTGHIQAMAQKVFQLIGCRDMARADFIVDQNNQAYFLEINTIPGFTSTSLLPMAAGHKGLNFTDLCLKIAGFACARRVRQKVV